MNKKRFLAFFAIFLLVALYVTTFILALCNFPSSDRLLIGFIMLDVAVPIMLWILLYVVKRFGNKE